MYAKDAQEPVITMCFSTFTEHIIAFSTFNEDLCANAFLLLSHRAGNSSVMSLCFPQCSALDLLP